MGVYTATESKAQSAHVMLASTDARMCERGAWCLSALSPSLLDLTCSLCHIPPRRACAGTDGNAETMYSPAAWCNYSACAEAISSIDDAVLILMKTGFTVLPRPRRVLVVACTRSKRVYMRARSGVRQGRAKGGSDAAGAARYRPAASCTSSQTFHLLCTSTLAPRNAVSRAR